MSLKNSKWAKMGNAGDTLAKSGGGFLPRHKFDKAQTAFLFMETRFVSLKTCSNGGTIPYKYYNFAMTIVSNFVKIVMTRQNDK